MKETSAETDDGTPILSLVHVDSIYAPCIDVPDMEEDVVSKTLRPTSDHGYIFIAPKGEWSEICQARIKSAPKSATITMTNKENKKKTAARKVRKNKRKNPPK